MFLNISSAEVYGGAFEAGQVTEDMQAQPLNVYGRSKFAAEVMAADVSPESARLIQVRPFNHSGPGQDERFVLPAFAHQIARIKAGLQEPVLKIGNLDVPREFLHVRDVVDAYVRLLEVCERIPSRAIFNVASGKPVKLSAILELLKERVTSAFSVVVDQNPLAAGTDPLGDGQSRPTVRSDRLDASLYDRGFSRRCFSQRAK